MGRGEKEDKRHEHPPLHLARLHRPHALILDRLHIFLHLSATLALLYYRASTIIALQTDTAILSLLSRALLLASDLLLAFLWALSQAFRWRPISRTAFPETLPGDDHLPPIDIFVCTADPEKEPTVEVMNTVVSAMCLDYPSHKLYVYLSDDGGSPATLQASRLAYSFAQRWLPFCRKYGIQTRCPEAYFGSEIAGDGGGGGAAFVEERKLMEHAYETFKENVESAKDLNGAQVLERKGEDRLPYMEVMQENHKGNAKSGEQEKMPHLVYVSREKQKRYPHHFKAGALNVLLRVSSTMSNSPYILVLDCDMYCNDTTSARQAMCFHLDPHLSPSLAFVQFPQTFRNVSKNDIYCAELRRFFKIFWKGCDGLKGPVLSGTGFYIKRDALYGGKPGHMLREDLASIDILDLRRQFGTSSELIASLRHNPRSNLDDRSKISSLQSEVMLLASCTYEIDTQWGEQVGFLYGSVVEDYFTGFHLHCRGWRSTYLYPKRQAFLGSVPINFHDTLVQNKRWASGLLEVGFSRFCPLTFGPASRNSLLQSMCYAWQAFWPLYSFPLLCYGTIPQLCLLTGISLFPSVSSPWFALFGAVYTSSIFQHLMEVILNEGSLRMWVNEQRWWMILSVTSLLFGSVNVIMKLVGFGEINFDLTSKATGKEQIQRYENGIFDFGGSSLVLVPLTTLSILNVIALVGGGIRAVVESSFVEMFGQLFLSFVVLLNSYPVLEGMTIRRDNGRVPSSITMISITLTAILVLLFSWLSY